MRETKKIPGFGGFTITRDGCVYSPQGEQLKEFELEGFLAVNIDGEDYHIKDLVYHTYVERLKRDYEVILLDDDTTNNSVPNLMCVTPQQKVRIEAIKNHEKRQQLYLSKTPVAGLNEKDKIERKYVRGSLEDRYNVAFKERLQEREQKRGLNAFGDKSIIGLDSFKPIVEL